MENSSFSTPVPENQLPRRSSNNLLPIILGVLLAGAAVFIVVDKTKSSGAMELKDTKIAQVTDEKSELQKSFDGSLVRLDSMAGVNTDLQSKLSEKTAEIEADKKEIRGILNNKNASSAELAKARNLIAKLNGNITAMQEEVARLTQDNQTLTQEKTVLTVEKTVLNQEKQKLNEDLTTTTTAKLELEKKVDIASTLNATNIAIKPINVKSNGKEKETTTAKRVDKLVISFDVDNRIATPGTTDVFVVVTGPDGRPVTGEALGSGTFTTRDEGDKAFTTKLGVDVETAKKKTVEFAFAPGVNFQQGAYIIQIYQNGFKIGEGTRQLKKGGLFS
ncbi:MAG: hypothetical protein ABIX01_23795 [Chitinophagaceae bacterium]